MEDGRAMKVLLAANFSSIHSRRYAELIAMAGCEVVLLEKGKFPQLSGELARRYHRWPRARPSLLRCFLGRRLAEKVGNALVEFQLQSLWRGINPDICHVQWIDDKAWTLTRIGISPVVLTAWGADIRMTQDQSCDPVLRRHKSEAVSNAALLIADSDDIIDIATELAQNSVSTELIPLGIDTSIFKPGLRDERASWRKELAIPPMATVALSPRGFQARYGHHMIISAFSRAVAKGQFDAYLVLKRFNGDDPGYLNEVNASVARLGIQDRIRMLDEVPYERLPSYYAMGDFAINFPVADAFPVTFMECLACGVPILTKELPAYNSFGIRPYLQFTDAPTEEALETAITMMLSECHTMGEHMVEARSYVCANFDEAVVARSLFRAYQRVLGC
jgi:glycosyltransferase involved in cell wall biosynthesis